MLTKKHLSKNIREWLLPVNILFRLGVKHEYRLKWKILANIV